MWKNFFRIVRMPTKPSSEILPRHLNEAVRALRNSGQAGNAILSQIEVGLEAIPATQGRLLDSLFVSLVADYESFAASSIRELASLDPKVACSGQTKFTLTDILESRENLVTRSVQAWADAKIYGGYKQWTETLRDDLGLKPLGKAHTQQFSEIFERRHAIIHNSSTAGSQYASCGAPLAKKGESLSVDYAYMSSAADTLLIHACNIAGRAMTHHSKNETEMKESLGKLNNSIYRLLRAERYSVVANYIESFEREPNNVNAANLIKVNRWLARKLQGDFKSVEGEVRTWDVDGLDPSFRMAKQALLGEDAKAYEISKRLVEQGDLALVYWLEWPILAGVRRYAHELGTFPVEPDDTASSGTD